MRAFRNLRRGQTVRFIYRLFIDGVWRNEEVSGVVVRNSDASKFILSESGKATSMAVYEQAGVVRWTL